MSVLSPDLKTKLAERFGPRVEFDAPMAAHTWFRVGGPADALVRPKDRAELKDLTALLVSAGVPWTVVGGGTNLLVKDRGIRGVVISPGRGMDQIRIIDRGPEQVVVQAGAAARLSALCRYAVDHDLSGMAFAAGIPGSVGGAILMNAGTRQGAMESVLATIEILQPPDREQILEKDALIFGYRHLSWKSPGQTSGQTSGQHPGIILAGRFALAPAAGSDPGAEMEAGFNRRRETQPKGFSAGCVFKNPSDEMPAGRLIDQAGLKGTAVGGARVSAVHANFIINEKGASAEDILQLIQIIQQRVKDRFGVALEPEIRIVGE